MQRESYVVMSSWLTDENAQRYFCTLNDGRFIVCKSEDLNDISYVLETSTMTNVQKELNSVFFAVEDEMYKFTADSPELAEKWISGLLSYPTAKVSLSDFTLLKVIGKGFSGEVILAKLNSTGKLVALKAISKENAQNANITKRAVSEKDLLLLAKDPLVARLYSTFQTSDTLFLVLEYVNGGDLGSHISKHRRFSYNQIKIYLAELAVALSHIHKLGIVFRDLKPANILIDSMGHLKITDFGLAKELDTSFARSLCGTHEYLAPEMLQGDPYTYAVDWWSFGVIAYQLLVGVLPFESSNLQKLYNQIMHGQLRFWKLIPTIAKQFLEGLLCKDPKHRLGCRDLGEDEIFSHPFFSDIDWQKVAERKYKMEFIPDTGEEAYADAGFEGIESSSSNEDLEHMMFHTENGEDDAYVPGFSYVGGFSPASVPL